jgi:hypothetical protein
MNTLTSERRLADGEEHEAALGDDVRTQIWGLLGALYPRGTWWSAAASNATLIRS